MDEQQQGLEQSEEKMFTTQQQGWASEEAMQFWLKDQLEQRGVRCRAEVVTHAQLKKRSDIVTEEGTVIECKKRLTRESIMQAYTQALTYKTHLGLSKIVLVGQVPTYLAAYQPAINEALSLQSIDPQVAIYWLRPDGLIQLGEERSSVLDVLTAPVAAPTPATRPAAPVQPTYAPPRSPAPLFPTWRSPPLVYVPQPVIRNHRRQPQPPVLTERQKTTLTLFAVVLGFVLAGMSGIAIGGAVAFVLISSIR